MHKLTQRIKDGDKTALQELQHIQGKEAAQILEQLRDDPKAYKAACIVLLKNYGNK